MNRKPPYLCEAEVTEGLEFASAEELREYGVQGVDTRPGEIDFSYSGDLHSLLSLKTVQSVSLVQSFAVPRPRGLLDNTNIRLLFTQIDTALALSPRGVYRTFFIAAAGSESSIMQRIKAAIA